MNLLNKYLVRYVFSILIIIFFDISTASASTSQSYVVAGGFDNTEGLLDDFSTAELGRLGASDDERIQSNGNWSIEMYDETKYVEFIFNPALQSDAIIESVSLSHEFYQTVKLTEAKLEVWDGTNWIDYPLQLPATSGTASEISQTVDISNTVQEADLVNSLKVRFLAYRLTTAVSIKTSHDQMNMNVVYSLPEPEEEIIPPEPEPEPEPEPTPEPEEEVEEEIPAESENLPEEENNQQQNNGVVSVLFLTGQNQIPVASTQTIAPTPSQEIYQIAQVQEFTQTQEIINPEISEIIETLNTEVISLNTQTGDTQSSFSDNSGASVIDTALSENETKIESNTLVASAGSSSSGFLGDNGWRVVGGFAILGSYLYYIGWQKVKIPKL